MMTDYTLTKEAVETLQRVITLKATIEVERDEKLVKICLSTHCGVRHDSNKILRAASWTHCSENFFGKIGQSSSTPIPNYLLAQQETVQGEQGVVFG